MQAFEQVMQSKRLFANNMFVLRQKDFEAFSTWWFDMLEAFEQAIELENYSDYQERIMGFMAERLLNVWFAKQQLKIKQLPVIYFKKFKSARTHKENIISEKVHSEKILTAIGR